MASVSNDNVGPLIAYLIPGAMALFGLSQFSPTVQAWFASSNPTDPSLGDFLYLTVASLAAGMVVNALRWAILDSLHARLGLALPDLDFSRLGNKVEAFILLIEIHYRHYQFYSNMFIATAIAYACYRVRLGAAGIWGWPDVIVGGLELIFFVTSRDTLRKYYGRATQLLSKP